MRHTNRSMICVTAVEHDKELRFCVQVAQLPVLYRFMFCWENFRKDADKDFVNCPFPDSIDDVHRDFMKIARKKGITRLSEFTPGFYAVDEALK